MSGLVSVLLACSARPPSESAPDKQAKAESVVTEPAPKKSAEALEREAKLAEARAIIDQEPDFPRWERPAKWRPEVHKLFHPRRFETCDIVRLKWQGPTGEVELQSDPHLLEPNITKVELRKGQRLELDIEDPDPPVLEDAVMELVTNATEFEATEEFTLQLREIQPGRPEPDAMGLIPIKLPKGERVRLIEMAFKNEEEILQVRGVYAIGGSVLDGELLVEAQEAEDYVYDDQYQFVLNEEIINAPRKGLKRVTPGLPQSEVWFRIVVGDQKGWLRYDDGLVGAKNEGNPCREQDAMPEYEPD